MPLPQQLASHQPGVPDRSELLKLGAQKGVKLMGGRRTLFSMDDLVSVRVFTAKMPEDVAQLKSGHGKKRRWVSAHSRSADGVVLAVSADGITVRLAESEGSVIEGSHSWAQNHVVKREG
eukprot:5017498-Prymnesium_polylepis.1